MLNLTVLHLTLSSVSSFSPLFTNRQALSVAHMRLTNMLSTPFFNTRCLTLTSSHFENGLASVVSVEGHGGAPTRKTGEEINQQVSLNHNHLLISLCTFTGIRNAVPVFYREGDYLLLQACTFYRNTNTQGPCSFCVESWRNEIKRICVFNSEGSGKVSVAFNVGPYTNGFEDDEQELLSVVNVEGKTDNQVVARVQNHKHLHMRGVNISHCKVADGTCGIAVCGRGTKVTESLVEYCTGGCFADVSDSGTLERVNYVKNHAADQGYFHVWNSGVLCKGYFIGNTPRGNDAFVKKVEGVVAECMFDFDAPTAQQPHMVAVYGHVKTLKQRFLQTAECDALYVAKKHLETPAMMVLGVAGAFAACGFVFARKFRKGDDKLIEEMNL